MLMTINVQCFDSTGVYPFSGSDHHLIVSNFYARDMYVLVLCLRFVFVKNLIQISWMSFLCVMIFGMMFYLGLITFHIVWNVSI